MVMQHDDGSRSYVLATAHHNFRMGLDYQMLANTTFNTNPAGRLTNAVPLPQMSDVRDALGEDLWKVRI